MDEEKYFETIAEYKLLAKHDKYVGEVDATNDIRFYGAKLKN